MDDMASKITEFLEDDRNVELLKTFSGFMKSDKKEEKQSDMPERHGGAAGGPPSGQGAPGGVDAGKIMEALGKFGSEDDRVRLLKALRPFISEKRRESLDSVTKILRLTQVISLFGDDLKLF